MAEQNADIKLVRMTRSEGQANGGPTQADVHPSEIENFRAAGFVEDEVKRRSKSDKE